MKAIGFVGSPRKNGNTEIITRHTLRAIEEEGLDTELIRLYEFDIRPCNACRVCREWEECPIDDDLFPLYTKVKEAEAIILASPVYCGSATAHTKAFMERAGTIARRGQQFAGKVGGPLVVARRAGKSFTFAQLMYWFHILEFFMPGSTYWNVAIASDEKGAVERDEEGLRTAWNFGKNIAFLVKKLKA